jgi:hypothetical protein
MKRRERRTWIGTTETYDKCRRVQT